MRTGLGLDVHALDGEPPLLLCGVVVSNTVGLSGTSDADVAAHAVGDALLGAAVLGDMGTHFPSSDPVFEGADSLDLLRSIVSMIGDAGFRVEHVDLTLIAQSVRIGPHRDAMRHQLAEVLAVDVGAVSIKATTTDGLGLIGRDEGVAAIAVATLG
ncbi:MAG: 2-C-methyl-D-erythritol 2,4-cyclodiphosphate synthase [Acidimicrobiia bacterium]|nr:2-C-methyl-D-erythritol 2,4-cyclodiphosphate synthase [Acidimicrobiia bacterium]